MSEVESFINDPQILRELIMDHYQYPHNHKLVKRRSLLICSYGFR